MKRVLLCAILLVGLTPNAYSTTAPLHYVYAYITDVPQNRDYPQNDQTLQINVVDPAHPDDVTLFSTLPVPQNPHYYLHSAFVSPSGQWIALLFFISELESGDNAEVWLFDIQTRQTKRIAQFLTSKGQSETFRELLDPGTDIRWSPDSRHMAWAAITHHSGLTFDHVFVYSVETGTLDELTPNSGNGDEFLFDWSIDGSRLAALNIGDGSNHFVIYDIAQKRQVVSIEFGGQGLVYPCYLAWSPDERYVIISFWCGIIDKTHEVLDLERQSLAQLGNVLTEPLPQTIYDKFTWYKSHTLVAGLTNRSNSGQHVVETHQTIAYDWPTGNRIVLNPAALDEWATNPMRSDTIALSATDVQIASFDGQSFRTKFHAPFGHGLTWSPDGKTLAYWKAIPVSVDDIVSFENLSEIVFVEAASLSISHHVPIFNQGDMSAQVGWLTLLH